MHSRSPLSIASRDSSNNEGLHKKLIWRLGVISSARFTSHSLLRFRLEPRHSISFHVFALSRILRRAATVLPPRHLHRKLISPFSFSFPCFLPPGHRLPSLFSSRHLDAQYGEPVTPHPRPPQHCSKALKLIKSGDVECESSASVTETPSPSSSIQQAPHSSVEPLDSASSSNAEERLSSRAEKRKRRKEEKQRQRQARLREEQK